MPFNFRTKKYHLGSLYCLIRSVSGRLLAIGSNDKIIILILVITFSEGEGKITRIMIF